MKAFGMFEILLVLAIMSMVAAFSLPYWRASYDRQVAEQFADQLYQLLRAGKLAAQSTQHWFVVCPMAQSQCGQTWQAGVMLVSLDAQGNILQVAERLPRPAGLILRWHGFPSRQRVLFTPNVGEFTQNGHFEILAPHLPRLIIRLNRLQHISREKG